MRVRLTRCSIEALAWLTAALLPVEPAAARPQDAAAAPVVGIECRDERGRPWPGAKVVLVAAAVPGVAGEGLVHRLEGTADDKGTLRLAARPGWQYCAWAWSRDGAGLRRSSLERDVRTGRPVALVATRGDQPKLALPGIDAWRERGAVRVDVWSHTLGVPLVEAPAAAGASTELPPLPVGDLWFEVSAGSILLAATVPGVTPQDIAIAIPAPHEVLLGLGGEHDRLRGAGVFEKRHGRYHQVGRTNSKGKALLSLPSAPNAEGKRSYFLYVHAEGHGEGYAERRGKSVEADRDRDPVAHADCDLVANLQPEMRLEGRLLLDGKPLERAPLLLYAPGPMGNDESTARPPTPPIVASTDAGGRFSLRNRMRLDYRLCTVVPDAMLAERHGAMAPLACLALGRGDRERIDLGDIDLRALVAVDCRVVTAAGAPAAYAGVAVGNDGLDLWNLVRMWQWTTDGKGELRLLLPRSDRWLLATVWDGHTRVARVPWPADTAPGSTLAVALSQAHAHHVAGIVVDAQGGGVAGSRVTASLATRQFGTDAMAEEFLLGWAARALGSQPPVHGATIYETTSDASGRFELAVPYAINAFELRAATVDGKSASLVTTARSTESEPARLEVK